MTASPDYSIVIPVYNSAETLPELAGRIDAVFADALPASYEIVFVNDGSTNPDTRAALREVCDANPNVRAIHLMRNYGKASAVLCGMRHARGDHVVTMDDDLQHLPEDLPKLAEMQDHDVVIGAFREKKHGPLAKLGSLAKSRFDRAIIGLPVKSSPYKLYRAQVTRAMVETASAQPFIPGLIMQVTRDLVEVEAQHAESRLKKSRFSLRRRIRQFLNLLIGHSTLLLRVLGVTGILAAIGGVLYALWILVHTLVIGNDAPPGWATLTVATLTLNGLILMSASLSGEYFIRILENTSRRPLYLVREEWGAAAEAQEPGAPADAV